MRIASPGQVAFAAAMIALGILGLARDYLPPVWDPVPKGFPAQQALIYLCVVISVGCGSGLLWRRSAAVAARVLLVYLLLWMVLFRVPDVVAAPTVVGAWFGVSEIAVVIAATWVLYAWFAAGWDTRYLGFATGARGVRIARILYGLALIHFGLAHFVYLNETVVLVPGWLPSHVAWAHFTGGAYIAAGVAVLVGVWARLAAALAALQIAGFTALVWIPIVAAGSKDPFQWSETILSCVLTAAAWVVADSYRHD